MKEEVYRGDKQPFVGTIERIKVQKLCRIIGIKVKERTDFEKKRLNMS